MRSYLAHLESLTKSKQQKPIFRASSLFPVIQTSGISTRILFMGYWLLKRHIPQLTAVFTLRAEGGELIVRKVEQIDEAKAYSIEVKDLAESLSSDFVGSIECEFYSGIPMVFPYPAVVINYYGPNFCTLVHTAQRVYNDKEDLLANTITKVPESGFDIIANGQTEPFFSLINGPDPVPHAKIEMTFYNTDKQTLKKNLELGTLAPYQTVLVHPAEEVDLVRFLQSKPGAAKVNFEVKGVFPRLIVGNRQKHRQALSITHTYYDCTKATNPSDYWRLKEHNWHLATLMIPCTASQKHFTDILFYPIYSPSTFTIDVEFYREDGRLLGKKESVLTLHSPGDKFEKIALKGLLEELKIPANSCLGARLIAKTVGNERIPARIKIGLDLGLEKGGLPCNICTNLQPFNPSLEGKPSTFRWCPVLADQPEATVWIMNSSQDVDYQRSAEIELTFYREKDSQTLKRALTLAPHGYHVIQLPRDEELMTFFGQTVGWVTAVSSNPYILTYYFSEQGDGMVGGDHGF